ncbi:MAG: Rrf2 family transcriptional regulator [bacterium]|nr:Rrf2 family transcriptional regulator [bacterium]
MKLSTKGEYASRAMLELSLNYNQGVVSIHEIAQKMELPEKYLEQILLALKNAGFVHSKRGVAGGYYLGKPPDMITVGQVIRVMDGPLAPISCVSQMGYEKCKVEPRCGLRSLWMEVRNAIADILDNTTFAGLCDRQLQLEKEVSSTVEMYHI